MCLSSGDHRGRGCHKGEETATSRWSRLDNKEILSGLPAGRASSVGAPDIVLFFHVCDEGTTGVPRGMAELVGGRGEDGDRDGLRGGKNLGGEVSAYGL